MMRRKIFFLLAGLLLSFYAKKALAGGYEFPGLGNRALSMGGAFIAVADDSTATYWNPAGLAQLEGRIDEEDFSFDFGFYKDRNSMRNPDPQDLKLQRGDTFFRINPGEPSRWTDSNIDYTSWTWSDSGYFPLDESTMMGYAFYVPNGNYVDWDDEDEDPLTQAGVKGTYFTSFFLMVGNFSLARKITPNFYLGVGLNILYGRFSTDAGKDYRGGIDPLNTNYEFDFESKASGWGAEGVFGALYKITPRLRVGAVYRTGASMRVRGHAMTRLKFKQQKFDEDFHDVSNFDQNFPLPPTWGVGLAYDITPKVTWAIDWQGTDWRVMEADINYDASGDALMDTHQSLDWHRSNRYRTGIEYRPNDTWALRFGYFWDENPVSDKSAAITTSSSMPMLYFTAGATYRFKNDWAISLAALNHRGKEMVDGELIRCGGTTVYFKVSIPY